MYIGILIVSDKCFRKEREDQTSVCLEEAICETFGQPRIVQNVVPDEIDDIKTTLNNWSEGGCDIIFTSGGTGFAPRDVTPEATRLVIEKECTGLMYTMISKSLAITEMAMLSRAVCGIRKKTLIINLPGSPKGSIECYNFIKNTLKHAVALIKDDKKIVEKLHNETPFETVNIKQEVHHSPTPAPTDVFNSSPSKVKMDKAASRPRESPYPLIEVDKACDMIISECIRTLDIETLPYNESVNRVLAQDIFAEEPIPSFPASVKDGYAVKSADTELIRTVRQVLAAGDEPCTDELKPGEVIRISTGAPVPPGADAVIQVEDTELVETSPDGKEVSIKLKKNPVDGQDIRAIGSDVAAGSLVLNKYDRLTPAHLGVLASLGKTRVKVFKPPSIALISTGNEVNNPDKNVKPGQIRDSNKTVLTHTLKKYSYNSTDCGIARDDPNSVKLALEKAFDNHDVVITTGGVSMGEFDVIKEVLIEDFNSFIHFGRVNMKPGKPTTFATLKYKGNIKYFFGLPGNPVSCTVTAIIFVIPTLRYLERSRNYKFPVVYVTLNYDQIINNDIRPEYHRIMVSYSSGSLKGYSTGSQVSSRLNSMVTANGLALVHKLSQHSYGQPYKTILFDDITTTEH